MVSDGRGCAMMTFQRFSLRLEMHRAGIRRGTPGVRNMSKEKSKTKETKKQPAMTPKEKKAVKQAKKNPHADGALAPR